MVRGDHQAVVPVFAEPSHHVGDLRCPSQPGELGSGDPDVQCDDLTSYLEQRGQGLLDLVHAGQEARIDAHVARDAHPAAVAQRGYAHGPQLEQSIRRRGAQINGQVLLVLYGRLGGARPPDRRSEWRVPRS